MFMEGSIVSGSPLFVASPRGARAHAVALVAALCCVGLPGVAAAQAAGPDMATSQLEPEYRLGPGDELSVKFPYNGELDHAGPVGPDGRFTLPQVGTIAIANMTVSQATQTIATTLRRDGIVENAKPSLTITQYGASVFVGGEVKTPGAVRLTGGMDAFRAIITAGGLLDTAKSKRIVVIRRGPEGTPQMHYVDLRAYLKHGPPSDAGLRSQDIVFVPKSSIAEVDLWVDQYINKVLPFSRGLNYNLGNAAVGAVTSR